MATVKTTKQGSKLNSTMDQAAARRAAKRNVGAMLSMTTAVAKDQRPPIDKGIPVPVGGVRQALSRPSIIAALELGEMASFTTDALGDATVAGAKPLDAMIEQARKAHGSSIAKAVDRAKEISGNAKTFELSTSVHLLKSPYRVVVTTVVTCTRAPKVK